jgi:ribulose-phosphate 3-epimerase
MSRPVKLAPSILSADFGRLAEQVREAELGGADWIHVDVMDGHFVPNITMGPQVVAAVRRASSLPLDVHLMIEQPERHLAAFANAGADYLTVHVETCPHLHRTLQQARELGAKPGVTLNPGTPVESLFDVLDEAALVLVMSVNPGFGGQRYLPAATRRIARIAGELAARGRDDVELQVDGGIDRTTAQAAASAGATVLVAGSAVYNAHGDVASNLRALRESIGEN